MININRSTFRWTKLPLCGEAGSALVETALTVPILIAMLLGAVDIGQVAYASIETANAARAGVQYAAMNGGGYNDTAGITTAAENDAYDTYTPHPTSFAVSSSSSCSCSDASACTNTSGVYSCGGTAKPIVKVTVQTTATFHALINYNVRPYFSSSPTFTLHGLAVQEVLE